MLGGTDRAEWMRQEELKRAHPDLVRTSFGIHPWRVERLDGASLQEEFEVLRARASGADAIGETGLDFYKKRDPTRFDLQREAFRLHLELARSLRKPMVLHVVAAHAEALRMVRSSRPDVPVLVHAFSGSAGDAKAWVAEGAILSFCGRLAGAGRRMTEALLATPVHQLVFETDAPDQAWRADGVNEPALVGEVYRAASGLLGVPEVELRQIVAENFAKII